MSKISTANTPRNLNINSGSAWARGPPATSPSSANNLSQPPLGPTQAQAPVPVPAPAPAAGVSTASGSTSNQPAVTRNVNGQGSHSRRPSAALGSSLQASSTALKDSVGVSKSVGSMEQFSLGSALSEKDSAAPIPSKAASNVQFGSIDDSNAVLSTSPAAPSTVTDLKQIKSFGSISAGSGEASPASPAVAKGNTPQRTDSPAPAGKLKKKLDVNSLFQKTQPTPAPTSGPSSAAPIPTPPTQHQQQQTNSSGPPPPAQDGPAIRPLPKQQGSFDSPSTRIIPLPMQHQPNQTPSPMQPGNGPASYHFSPPSHLRQSGNGGPGANPPRSPGFNRAMTNGSMRGPPGTSGSGGLGSPRMGHPSITPGPAPATPSQTPLSGMPPNMMNVPGSSVPHPQHMPGPIPPVPHGQIPHQMGMPQQMWGYYYNPQYDPNMPPYPYWQPHPAQMPPHMAPPHGPQQTPLAMQPSNLPTPSQPPMTISMSPRVPPAGTPQIAPQTPSSPHPSLAQAPAGSRSSFIASKRVLIKNSAGEAVDLADLSKKAPSKQEDGPAASVKKDETASRPVSNPVRFETPDAHRKRMEEEKLKDKDKSKKDDELAKVKAKRDAEARERAKRDQEEKERRQKEQEEAKNKELDEKERAERAKRAAEEAEKERIKREEEQEKERLKKLEEEKERTRLETEAKEAARLAELEAKKKEEEEIKRKAEEETKRKAEEEAKRKEEEEAKRKEEEEAKRLAEEARLKAEAEAEQKEEEARRLKEREEQEAAAAAAAAVNAIQATDSASQASTPLGSTPAYPSPARSVSALPPKSALPRSLDPKRRPVPDRLDLSSTASANLPQPLPSALASARIIEDIGKVSYPEGIKAPSSELNVNASSGKFRYDRDFLMQFMRVCKEKPDDMPSLDAIGLEPSEQQGNNFAGRRGRPSIPATASSRGAMGLGLPGPGGTSFGAKSFGGGGMGQFQAPRSSEERFAAASIPRAVPGGVQFPRQAPGRTNSTSGPPIQGAAGRRGETPQRTHSGRGTKRTDSKVGQPPSGMHNLISAEPDLHHAENSWSTQRRPAAIDQNSPEFIDRKVKALLNKLTMEKFDSISEQILEWANRSVNEVDGRTLIQVIRLVFEKATDEATWSEMYARLCRFLMERISQDVRDEGIKNADGKPIAGGNLFRKYLLNRCQEDFERGWSAREAAMLAAASKAEDDKAIAAAAEKAGGGEEVLYSDEYYASQKAKRRGLGLVKFIGELFKLQMLTERIMHECIKKLLSNVENPEEEEIESLCKLLATVGQALDTPKARNHMDIYFGRMQELANSGQISSRIQYMLIDIIELRTRKWVSRTQVAAPTTIAEVHQKAERDRQVAEREAALRQAGGRDHMRGGRRDTRDYGPPQVGADGWTTPAVRPPTKAGDLSNFGKISKSTTISQFGPSSVFSKKERRESGSVTRASSSSNMFAALNSSEATPDAGSVGSRTANSTRPPSRKGSIDLSASSIADMTPQRKRLLLQPRTQAFASDAGSVKDDGGSVIGQSELGDEDAASATASTSAAGTGPAAMSLDQAKRKIKEDIKELFMLRQASEAETYFSTLPPEFRWHLVEELVHRAVDARATEVQLISDVFELAASKSLVDEEQLERGFLADLEYLEDTSTDSPNAYGNVASLLKAARLSSATIDRLADKIIVEGEMAVTPKEKLLKKYAAPPT